MSHHYGGHHGGYMEGHHGYVEPMHHGYVHGYVQPMVVHPQPMMMQPMHQPGYVNRLPHYVVQ